MAKKAFDVARVEGAAAQVRLLFSGKASLAGVAALLAALDNEELELVAFATRQPSSSLRRLAAAGGAQLVT